MNDAERMQKFLAEYDTIRQKYGYEFAAKLSSREMGIQLQIEPVLGLQDVDDWQPPDQGESKPADQGK